MKYRMRQYVCIALGLLYIYVMGWILIDAPQTSFAQTMKEDSTKWTKDFIVIEELLTKGQYETAAQKLKNIQLQAQKSGEQDVQLKAALYVLATLNNAENPFTEQYQYIQTQLKQSKGVQNHIWQAVKARLLWTYYQNNLYQIIDRSEVNEQAGDDVAYWTNAQFKTVIQTSLDACLHQPSELLAVKADAYSHLIDKGVGLSQYRPTLYHVMAFDAIDFYQMASFNEVQSSQTFKMSDARLFSDAETFEQQQIETEDVQNHQYKILKLFQSLLIHSKSSQELYTDIDIQRLQYVYHQIELSDKDEQYMAALHKLSQKAQGEVYDYAKAQWLLANFQRLKTDQPKAYEQWNTQAKLLLDKYKDGRIPNSLYYLYQTNTKPTIQITSEDVLLPNTPNRFLITSKLCKTIAITAYKVSVEDYLKYKSYADQIKLDGLKAVAQQQYDFSSLIKNIYVDAKIEVPFKALPLGHYVLLVEGTDVQAHVPVQVSELGIIKAVASDHKSPYQVVSRLNNKPMSQLNYQFLKHEYDQNKHQYVYNKSKAFTSDNGTIMAYTEDESLLNYYSGVLVRHGEDVCVDLNVVHIARTPKQTTINKPTKQVKHSFYTDRGLYRPGQTLYFKVIALEQEDNRTNVLAWKDIEVQLKNANNKVVKKVVVTTNAFGSASGIFELPEDELPGSWQMVSTAGLSQIQIEAYKRPQFFVTLDSIIGEPKLGDQVNIQGHAMAFNGSVISQAKVDYVVTRERQFCWWYSYKWNRSVEQLETGTLETDESGAFKISFPTKKEKDKYVRYNYRVEVNVTDINGEQHKAVKSFVFGQQSLYIHTNLSNALQPKDSVLLTTKNVEGQFRSTEVQVQIYQLKSPTQYLRQRIWEQPQYQYLDKKAFKELFPNDAYEDDNNIINWQKGKQIVKTNWQTRSDGASNLDPYLQEPGYYVVTIALPKEAIVDTFYVKRLSDEKSIDFMPLSLQSVEKGYLAQSLLNNIPLLRWHVKDGKVVLNDQLLVGKDYQYKFTEKDTFNQSFNVILGGFDNNRWYWTSQPIYKTPTASKYELMLVTSTDLTQPGSKQQWRYQLLKDKHPINEAEMLLTVYDASLDALQPFNYSLPSFNKSRISVYFNLQATQPLLVDGYGNSGSDYFNIMQWSYPRIDWTFLEHYSNGYLYRGRQVYYKDAAPPSMAAVSRNNAEEKPMLMEKAQDVATEANVVENQSNETPDIRENLSELATFQAALSPDEDGFFDATFTMPDALTSWKSLAVVHTKDGAFAMKEHLFKTQKDLMVQPNFPRFIRQGDQIDIISKVSNLTKENLNVVHKIQILNALNDIDITHQFRIEKSEQKGLIKQGLNGTCTWTLHTPMALVSPIKVVVSAQSEKHSDAMVMTLPVISNRVLVTLTEPLQFVGNVDTSFVFEELVASKSSSTISHKELMLEFTPDPKWLILQSLPAVMTSSINSADQIAYMYLAHKMGYQLVRNDPSIAGYIRAYKGDTIQNGLYVKQHVKLNDLDATPWVSQAEREALNFKALHIYLNENWVNQRLDSLYKQLKALQTSDGGFSWFKGGRSSSFTTLHVLNAINRMRAIGEFVPKNIQAMELEAVKYLDKVFAERWYKVYSKEPKSKLISYEDLLYLMTKVNAGISVKDDKVANNYYSLLEKNWTHFNTIGRVYTYSILKHGKSNAIAKEVFKGIEESVTISPKLGAYWSSSTYEPDWFNDRILTVSQVLQVMLRDYPKHNLIPQLQRFLISNKQTVAWRSSMQTMEACYAFMKSWQTLEDVQPSIVLSLGNAPDQWQATMEMYKGSGHFSKAWLADNVKPELGNGQVTISKVSSQYPTWGAVYWQYYDELNKVPSTFNGLKVTKQYFVKGDQSRKGAWQLIEPSSSLVLGTQVMVRIQLEADRPFSYVHLQDSRPSGFEPTQNLSGYIYKNGMVYYHATGDINNDLFIEYLPKGQFVIEQVYLVNNLGHYQTGLTQVQSYYAPAFKSIAPSVKLGN